MSPDPILPPTTVSEDVPPSQATDAPAQVSPTPAPGPGPTPGPWELFDRTIRHQDGCWRAVSGGEKVGEPIPRWQSVALVTYRGPEMTLANGRILAAAPELLEACRALVDYFGHIDLAADAFAYNHLQAARIAVAKAEGR